MKIFTVIAAVVGVGVGLAPWVEVSYTGQINGIQTLAGMICMGALVISLIITLTSENTRGASIINIITGAIALMACLYFQSNIASAQQVSETTSGWLGGAFQTKVTLLPAFYIECVSIIIILRTNIIPFLQGNSQSEEVAEIENDREVANV